MEPNPISFNKSLYKRTDVQKSKMVKPKSKRPATKQITAEQIVREAQALQSETEYKPQKQLITEIHELEEYQLSRRKEFEDLVRRMRWNSKIWLKYSHWEESQQDFRRARSVYERLIDLDYTNTQVWLKYVEMEMRHGFINHARNVWNRAVELLPRVDQLWYKYIHMEEMLGNCENARKVLERWMAVSPNQQGLQTFINFELRNGEPQNVRNIYERYITSHPTPDSWVKYAKFEIKQGNKSMARNVFERAVDELGSHPESKKLYIEFAQFEIKSHEYTRARFIYSHAMEKISRHHFQSLFDDFILFEKQYGNRQSIEEALVNKRRLEYENNMHGNSVSYDIIFDYIRLEEQVGDKDKVRDVYERAVSFVPPLSSKHLWRRYIYIWINYALFEEIEMNNIERARQIYHTVLHLIPHKTFTFAKIWVLAAQLEVRKKNLPEARALLGRAIGICPKVKIFKKYIEMEFYMGNIDSCRTICEKYIEFCPSNCDAWLKYAEMEITLEETERVRSIFELAISQPLLNMPELLWKSYIDFEIQQMDRKRVRKLYERLVEKSKHVKIWLGYAAFESCPLKTIDKEKAKNILESEIEESPQKLEFAARSVYNRAYERMKEDSSTYKKEIFMILEAWWDFEKKQENNSCTTSKENQIRRLEKLSKKMPRKVKRKRKLFLGDGQEVGTEEYWDVIFPEECFTKPGLKLLEAAYKWKKRIKCT